MTLIDGTILYHGSYAQVRTIDPDKCQDGKDFGRGFYTTTSMDQARSFVSTSLRKAKRQHVVPLDAAGGFVSVFRYREPHEPVPTFEFESADRTWLEFVAKNRRRRLDAVFADRIPTALSDAEIIIGKIANDTTNRVIAAYLDGLFGPVDTDEAVHTAISQLMPERLQDQICFITQRAIGCLEFLEVRRYG